MDVNLFLAGFVDLFFGVLDAVYLLDLLITPPSPLFIFGDSMLLLLL